jgi:hypothetical protein
MKKQDSEEVSQAQTELLLNYKKCFSSKEGRAVLNDLIRNHSIASSTVFFDRGGNSSPYYMYFNEGARNVVLRILNVLEKSPEDILKMQEEAKGGGNGYFRE